MVLYFVGSDQEAMENLTDFFGESDISDLVVAPISPYNDHYKDKLVKAIQIGGEDSFTMVIDFDNAFMGKEALQEIRDLPIRFEED